MSDRKARRELSEVLLEELEMQLHGRLPETPPPAPRDEKEEKERREKAIARLHRDAPERSALCLSGGGIRSASFSLGVLQTLAERGLLKQFDYLSTVSGGGYIGGWLSAWISRTPGGVEKIEELLAPPAGTPRPPPLEPEPEPLRHLRTFSNYLSPKLGLFSADSWTLLATVVRNLFLNWLVLISLLTALMLAPYCSAWAVNARPGGVVQWLLLGGSFALLSLALSFPPADLPNLGNLRRQQSTFLGLFLAPLFGGILLLAAWWAAFRNTAATRWFGWRGDLRAAPADALFDAGLWPGGARTAMIFFGAVCLCGSLVSIAVYLARGWKNERRPRAAVLQNLARLCALTTLLGVAGGWVLAFFANSIFANPAGQVLGYVIGAPPLLLGAFFFLTTLFIGLSSFHLEDEDREWWGRALGWIGIAMVAWAVPHTLMLYATAVVVEQGSAWWEKLLTASGGLLGLAGAIYGFSARSAAKKDRTGRHPVAALLPAAAAVLFFLLLGCGISWVVKKVVFAEQLKPAESVAAVAATSAPAPVAEPNPLGFLYDADGSGTRRKLGRSLALVAAAVLLGAVMGFWINVNKFSLHTMYRLRIIRAFLGASRRRALLADSAENVRADGAPPPDVREPHPFTGFDPHDNLDLCQLARRKLFHVVNMALNIVHGEELAWQERKASSFTASPLHCGNWRVGYRPSARYGDTISLGTAVAISGAAANPNAGYHSSPVVTFLMTVFNLRLGWWLGNPSAAAVWERSGPRHAAWPLFAEALGQTRERSAYLNLSDGGHFENLGVYEMVLRRCRRILAIDGGCDGAYTFEDLGNLIRKVRIDFGIDITITLTRLIPLPDEKRRFADSAAGPLLYCACGTIAYHQADGTPAAEDGELIYLKPMMTDTAPADVANYHSAHPEFPHESTGDQFFSESQFESYRALGEHQLCTVLGEGWPAGGSLGELFARAKDYAVGDPAPHGEISLARTLPIAGAEERSN